MQLHDHTRRHLTLLLFFLLGPMLTATVLGVIVWRQLPTAVRGHERLVKNHTGLNIRLAAVRELRPGTTQYVELRLLDPETKATILSCPELTITFVRSKSLRRFESTDQTEATQAAETEPEENRQTGLVDVVTDAVPFRRHSPGFWRITASKVTVHFDRVPADLGGTQLKEFFFGLLSHRRGPSDSPLEFAVDTLEIKTPTEVALASRDARLASKTPLDLLLTFLRGRFYSTERSTRMDVSWSFPNYLPGEEVAFHAVRTRTGPMPSTHLKFTVPEDEYVPVTLLALFVPQFEPFGPLCRFNGTIRGDYLPTRAAGTGLARETAWNIVWEGVTLRSIDLAPLAAEYTPYRVTGMIDGIGLESAEYRGGLVSANGWVEVSGGTMEKELLQRLVGDFGLIVKPEGFTQRFPGETIPFDRCLFRFALTPSEATFRPFPGSEDNIIMQSREGIMNVSTPPTIHAVPIPNLLAVMMKAGTPAIPWTPGTGKIMSFLPAEAEPPKADNHAPSPDKPTHPSQLPLPEKAFVP